MKRFIFAIVMVFGILFALWVSAEEIKELSWDEKYSDKPVVHLLVDRVIEVKEDWSFINKVHCRTKIQTEEGKEHGEIPFYYNKSDQEITELEAYTITPDGKKHKYTKIQDFPLYDGYPMYSDWMVKVVTMPEVVVDSILEYKGTTVTRKLGIDNHFWWDNYFGGGRPRKEYNLKVILPKKLGIRYREFNLPYKPVITETDTTITYSWKLKELEESEREGFRPPPTPDTVTNCAQFSSIGSWSDVSDWYSDLIKKNTIINSEIESKAKELVKNKTTLKDKVRAVLEYLQKDFRYVSMSLGDHALEPHPTDEVFKNKYGDCKDLSLLCKAMLEIVGIDSKMALFQKESRISDPQYDLPFPRLFNHVLLEVEDPSGNFYIDPLLQGYDIGEYASGYQAAYTFIITEDGGRFDRFPVFDEKRMYSMMDNTVEIKEDGSAIFNAESLWDLDFSIEIRDKWRAMSQKQKDKFLQILDVRHASGGKMIERYWENIDEKYGHIKSFVKYERPNAYPLAGDMMIIPLGRYDRVSSFAEEERENPIFFPGNSLEEESTTYIMPQGFKATYVPENLDLDVGFFNYKRNYEVEENKITVKEVTKYSRKEVPAEKYKEVQDFYDKLPGKTDQRIIIKKVADKQEMEQLKQAWSK